MNPRSPEALVFSKSGIFQVRMFGKTWRQGHCFEVRGQTVWVKFDGYAMTKIFELVDKNTIRSDLPGWAGVYTRKAGN